MHHCKLEGLTKAFTAMLTSLQMNDPFSVKVCHFDCIFRTTASYSFITESTIKKRATYGLYLCAVQGSCNLSEYRNGGSNSSNSDCYNWNLRDTLDGPDIFYTCDEFSTLKLAIDMSISSGRATSEKECPAPTTLTLLPWAPAAVTTAATSFAEDGSSRWAWLK